MSHRFGFDLKGWNFGSDLDPKHAHKIVVAWNLGVAQRYWKLAKLMRHFSWAWRLRPIHINRRFGLAPQSGPVRVYQHYRSISLDVLAPLGRDFRCTGARRVSSKQYYLELGASRIVFSPFGWGELCFRDYEGGRRAGRC